MICILTNSCTDKYLCCAHCGNKKCEQRCKDNKNTCKWYDGTKEYKIPENSNYIEIKPSKSVEHKQIKRKLI